MAGPTPTPLTAALRMSPSRSLPAPVRPAPVTPPPTPAPAFKPPQPGAGGGPTRGAHAFRLVERGLFGRRQSDDRLRRDLSGGASFTGDMAEINTFAKENTPQLFSTVRGSIDSGGFVRFTKTYDGTGGVSHSVQYQGQLVRRRAIGQRHVER